MLKEDLQSRAGVLPLHVAAGPGAESAGEVELSDVSGTDPLSDSAEK